MDQLEKDNHIKAALKVVEDGLSDLQHQKRVADDLIENQHKQIKILREESAISIEYWRRLYLQTCTYRDRNEKIVDRSIMTMLAALIISFIAIGYAVWLSS